MILTGINAMYTIVMQKIPSLIPTGINALYAVVMQGIACQYLFGKDSGLYQNLTKNQCSEALTKFPYRDASRLSTFLRACYAVYAIYVIHYIETQAILLFVALPLSSSEIS